MKKTTLLLFASLFTIGTHAQKAFTRKDSLQGGPRIERTCFDVQHYKLNLKLDIDKKYISGSNTIDFKIVSDTRKIQLDLFENMKVDSIVMGKKKLKYKREFNAVFIELNSKLRKDEMASLTFYYSGNPIIAKNAPWDGGFVFTKDTNGKPWVGVAVQGTGASLWYPVKDGQTDEPDNGANISISVPDNLTAVSNGRFVKSESAGNGYTRWDWRVVNPINNYDITLYVGDYVHFGETYGGLDLDYYVLRENEAKARKQFEGVKPMLDCFSSKFGPYPFPEDGYKLVESPYLGMEHQSAVAYGNHYQNGYLGNDLSGTGKGLTFDFILVHESGHEWFGNSITSQDVADMWIHEGFTCYSESVYLECQENKAAASTYINGLRKQVENDRPVIGNYGVNNEGSGDMYFKGALMLNTIRNIIGDDGVWWGILGGMNQTFRHKIITTEDVIAYFNKQSGQDLTETFNQYLRYKDVPVLELRRVLGKLEYRWVAGNPKFNMPVDIIWRGNQVRLTPTKDWQTSRVTVSGPKDVTVLTDNFYITVKN